MHHLAALSFAEKAPSGQMNLWTAKPDMPWPAANAEGRRRADEMVAFMQVSESPVLLSHVISAIIERREELGGIEIGFFTRIAALVMEAEVPVHFNQPLLSVVSNDAG